MIKTLIGKNNYLFLINDSAKEMEVHCNNLNLVNDKKLSRYNLDNKFLLIVIPNKSLIYKDFLPDNYKVKYRPALDDYKKIFGNKIIDTYEILKNETDIYFKTDTHINMKGNYIVYKYFIEKLNNIYGINIKSHDIILSKKECILSSLNYGIGDLTWETNLGGQIIEDKNKMDVFYYSSDVEYIYCKHKITINDEIRILNKDLFIDINNDLQGKYITWEIMSNNILYRKNETNETNEKLKVLIFYDSFLISLLDLYLRSFSEVYMIKEIYNKKYIDIIKPDYIFEFRAERFLF